MDMVGKELMCTEAGLEYDSPTLEILSSPVDVISTSSIDDGEPDEKNEAQNELPFRPF